MRLLLLGAAVLAACASDPAPADAPATPAPETVEAPSGTAEGSNNPAAVATPDAPEVSSASDLAPADTLTPAMQAHLDAYLAERRAEMGLAEGEASASVAITDLSVPEPDWEMQGSTDVLVLWEGPTVCGTGGCTLDIASFSLDAEAFLHVASIGLVKTPVRVAESSTSGWRDLVVHVGGGGLTPYESLLQVDLGTDNLYPTEADEGATATEAQVEGATVVLM